MARNYDEISARVPAKLGGERLDRALVALTEGFSRSRIQALVRAGRVQLDGEPVLRPNHQVHDGALLVLSCPSAPEPESPAGEPIRELAVLYEDEQLAVVDKPAGLLVHATDRPEARTLADLAVERFGPLPEVQGALRPGIVHRLDRLTSGVMLIGRSAPALEHLKAQFQARSVDKTYLAICHGRPRFDSEWVDAPIGPSPRHRGRFGIAAEGEGRPATTFVEARELFAGFSLIAAAPKTGRTHQVRVHLRHLGLPIVGDRLYRHPGALAVPVPAEAPALQRQALHASRIEFEHPSSGERVAFEAPLPPDMAEFLAFLRGAAAGDAC